MFIIAQVEDFTEKVLSIYNDQDLSMFEFGNDQVKWLGNILLVHLYDLIWHFSW